MTATKNRIDQLFETKKNNILNIFFTAGHPKLEDTIRIIKDLEQAGVDLIEIGMPYSDPLADGLTIQKSSSTALANGMELDVLFEQIKTARQTATVPLILMGYFNQMMQYGIDKFCGACRDTGVDGLIIPDLPMDIYEEEFQEKIRSYGLNVSFLITPQTSDERIQYADKLSDGFIYMVSSSSTTGAKQSIKNNQLDYFKRINSMNLATPRLIGFGISNHATYARACEYSNGAIIGSAFINRLNEDASVESILGFVKMVRG